MKSYIAEILRTLGATPCYRGFTALVYAICLVVDDESRLDNAMRDVYLSTAVDLNLDVYNIERNIRTIIHRVWQVDKTCLSDMAGYKLDGPPSYAAVKHHQQRLFLFWGNQSSRSRYIYLIFLRPVRLRYFLAHLIHASLMHINPFSCSRSCTSLALPVVFMCSALFILSSSKN